MDEITLENFRCFREKQTARLAPLTLLVGENSTGKTSFLAMIRALSAIAIGNRAPDFKEDPYDLGSFDEIAHYRGGRGGRAETFEAGFYIVPRAIRGEEANGQPYRFEVTFKKTGTVPYPVKIRLSHENVWVNVLLEDRSWQISFGTPRGAWKSSNAFPYLEAIYEMLFPLFLSSYSSSRRMVGDRESEAEPIALQGSNTPTSQDWEQIDQLVDTHFFLKETARSLWKRQSTGT